jgi:hypothetical protein
MTQLALSWDTNPPERSLPMRAILPADAEPRRVGPMPPQAYALVTLFTLCSIVLGITSVRVAAVIGGPRSRAAYVMPVLAAFGAFYLIGHRLRISPGPEVALFGFQVALVGDLAIGLIAALAMAVMQLAIARARARRLPAG